MEALKLRNMENNNDNKHYDCSQNSLPFYNDNALAVDGHQKLGIPLKKQTQSTNSYDHNTNVINTSQKDFLSQTTNHQNPFYPKINNNDNNNNTNDNIPILSSFINDLDILNTPTNNNHSNLQTTNNRYNTHNTINHEANNPLQVHSPYNYNYDVHKLKQNFTFYDEPQEYNYAASLSIRTDYESTSAEQSLYISQSSLSSQPSTVATHQHEQQQQEQQQQQHTFPPFPSQSHSHQQNHPYNHPQKHHIYDLTENPKYEHTASELTLDDTNFSSQDSLQSQTTLPFPVTNTKINTNNYKTQHMVSLQNGKPDVTHNNSNSNSNNNSNNIQHNMKLIDTAEAAIQFDKQHRLQFVQPVVKADITSNAYSYADDPHHVGEIKPNAKKNHGRCVVNVIVVTITLCVLNMSLSGYVWYKMGTSSAGLLGFGSSSLGVGAVNANAGATTKGGQDASPIAQEWITAVGNLFSHSTTHQSMAMSKSNNNAIYSRSTRRTPLQQSLSQSQDKTIETDPYKSYALHAQLLMNQHDGLFNKVKVNVGSAGNPNTNQKSSAPADELTIPESGIYFVFYGVLLVYEGRTRCALLPDTDKLASTYLVVADGHENLMRSEHTCCESCPTEHSTDFAGGVFRIQAGSRLHLEVSDPKLVEVGENTFIGYFMVDSKPTDTT